MSAIKNALKQLTPPAALPSYRALKRLLLRQRPPWEYVPNGWDVARTDPKLKGWNDVSVVQTYEARWPAFKAVLDSTLPLAVAPEHAAPEHLGATRYDQLDLFTHNVVMSFAYALAVSSRHKQSLTMLDWGGGIGHYYLLARTLVPDLRLEYHCYDVDVCVDHGRRVLPEVHFSSDDGVLTRQYEFVLASGSFHYARDWQSLLERLAQATNGRLFITQLPVVHQRGSFVVVQRPYAHGYNTEYLGWCLNRSAFLALAQRLGLVLVREFVSGYQPDVYRAPEPPEYRGFLFEKVS